MAGPAPTKVATLFAKVATALLLEVQVVEFVTSVPLRVAENVAVVPFVKVVPLGTEEISRPWPFPVTSPVADPATPFNVAVIVTPVIAPTPFTFPPLTVAQGVELCHVAVPDTSLLPSL